MCYLESFFEESKQHCHPVTYRLGSRSAHNATRDFWSFCKIPVVTWLQAFLKKMSRMCLAKLSKNMCFWAGSCNLSQETVTIQAPLANPKLDPPYEMKDLKLLEPFSVVRYMFCEAGLAVDYEAVKKFWAHHWEVGSPWAKDTTATDQHIPLGLHGDGAKIRQIAFQPAQKMVGIFLNAPLWRPKSCRASRWLLCAIREEDLYQHFTLNAIYHHIVWSLNCLHDGVFPSTGPNGEELQGKQKERAGSPICNGMKFAVTEVRGDWLYHKQLLRFRSSWAGGAKVTVCFQCPAWNFGPDRFYDVSETSPLWMKQYSLIEFLVQQMPHQDPSAQDDKQLFMCPTCTPIRSIGDFVCHAQ